VDFHFQVRNETHVWLTEVVSLQNSDAARVEAARRIGILLHDHAGQLWTDESWQMDVTDHTGLVLFVIQVQTLKSAASAGRTAMR
jgi:hypothetical protein